jgi:hypothetical protein
MIEGLTDGHFDQRGDGDLRHITNMRHRQKMTKKTCEPALEAVHFCSHRKFTALISSNKHCTLGWMVRHVKPLTNLLHRNLSHVVPWWTLDFEELELSLWCSPTLLLQPSFLAKSIPNSNARILPWVKFTYSRVKSHHNFSSSRKELQLIHGRSQIVQFIPSLMIMGVSQLQNLLTAF